MDKIIYFDHAATTKVDEDVLKEMIPFFNMEYGNPSSIYKLGRDSKRKVEESRRKVAEAINADPKEIYFTSCGSESDNLAIKGIAYKNKSKGNRIITTKIEHPAVLNACRSLEREGFDVVYLNVDEKGLIRIKELENSINEKTILITIMFANNEIGTIEPIEEIGEIAKRYGVVFHTDAVQAAGNIPIDVKKMGIDSLSISAHKFYGPKGVGALYVKDDIEFIKLQDGGHQEKDKRAGTENLPGIVGISKAIEIATRNMSETKKKLIYLRDYCISEIESKISYVRLNGDKTNRLPCNINMSFQFIDGGDLLLELDKNGICTSAGSACSSGIDSPSHVLVSIGCPKEYIEGTLRITIGKDNTKEEIDFFIEILVKIVEELRHRNPEYKKVYLRIDNSSLT